MKRFLIFGRERSGTTLLCRLLNQHPEILCCGEALHPDRRTRHERIATAYKRHGLTPPPNTLPHLQVKRIWGEHPAPIAAAGFKVINYHLTDGICRTPADTDRWIRKVHEAEADVIVIERENRLARITSAVLSYQIEQWHARSDRERREERPQAPVTMERLLTDDQTVEQMRELQQRLGVTHRLTYENLVENPQDVWDELCNLLGVTQTGCPSPDLVKMERRPLSQAIEGYEDLRRQARGTHWEDFFENDSEPIRLDGVGGTQG